MQSRQTTTTDTKSAKYRQSGYSFVLFAIFVIQSWSPGRHPSGLFLEEMSMIMTSDQYEAVAGRAE